MTSRLQVTRSSQIIAARLVYLCCLVGLCTTVSPAQQSIEEVIREVKSQRQIVRPYIARVTEKVDNLGSDEPLGSGELSWGNRDGIRQVEVRFKDGTFKIHTDSCYGSNTNGLPPLEKSWRLIDGRLESSEPTLKIGEVMKSNSPEFLLTAFNYWVDGQPLDSWISDVENATVTRAGELILIQGEHQGIPSTLYLDPNNAFVISRLMLGANREVDDRVL